MESFNSELAYGLSSLKELNASNNDLMAVPHFPDVNNLQKLDLSYNPIEYSDAGSFAKLSKLTNLNLAHTNLSGILADMFSYQENLQFVDLSGNLLKSIDFSVFVPSFYSLESLYLDENEINELTEMPSYIFPKLFLLKIY